MFESSPSNRPVEALATISRVARNVGCGEAIKTSRWQYAWNRQNLRRVGCASGELAPQGRRCRAYKEARLMTGLDACVTPEIQRSKSSNDIAAKTTRNRVLKTTLVRSR